MLNDSARHSKWQNTHTHKHASIYSENLFREHACTCDCSHYSWNHDFHLIPRWKALVTGHLNHHTMRQDPLTHAQITDKQPSNQQWFCNTVFDNTNSFIAAFQLPSCSSSNHLSSYSGVWAKYFCFIMFFGKVNIKPDYETDKILSVHQRMLLVLCFLSCGGWIVGDNEIQAQKFRHLPELVMVNRSRRLCCWKKRRE